MEAVSNFMTTEDIVYNQVRYLEIMDIISSVMPVIVLGFIIHRKVSTALVGVPLSTGIFMNNAVLECVYIMVTEKCQHTMELWKMNHSVLTNASMYFTPKEFSLTQCLFMLKKAINVLIFVIYISNIHYFCASPPHIFVKHMCHIRNMEVLILVENYTCAVA